MGRSRRFTLCTCTIVLELKSAMKEMLKPSRALKIDNICYFWFQNF